MPRWPRPERQRSHKAQMARWGAEKSGETDMSKRLAMVVFGLLLSSASFGQVRVTTPDFVTKVAMSDMLEIETSQLALSRQPDADTKPFAEKRVSDHQQTSRELKQLVDSGKVKAPLPASLDADLQKKLVDLKAKMGKDFDRAFDQMQVQAHEEAVALFEEYSKAGDNAELKAWAAKTLPHLKEHLEMAKKLS
jgi:putative membrane protein